MSCPEHWTYDAELGECVDPNADWQQVSEVEEELGPDGALPFGAAKRC